MENRPDEKRIQAINMLKLKQEETGKIPVRDDFDPTEVSFIKSKLGPWPRALEAAGLKEPKPGQTAAEKSRKKRAQARKKLRMLKEQTQKE